MKRNLIVIIADTFRADPALQRFYPVQRLTVKVSKGDFFLTMAELCCNLDTDLENLFVYPRHYAIV